MAHAFKENENFWVLVIAIDPDDLTTWCSGKMQEHCGTDQKSIYEFP